jgi:hypothetical protein
MIRFHPFKEALMHRLVLVALALIGMLPAVSSAVEIKNIRPCYAPFGATRYKLECLPGDVLFVTYDIEDLVLKDGKASYTTILELLDGQGKTIFKKDTDNDVVPQLGGTRMPGDLHVIMGPKQAPGKYAIKLTVHDKFGKNAKAFRYEFDVVAEKFGFVGVSAPAVGFPGQHYVTGFALVNMGLDAKKQPNAEVTIRILDEKGVAVATPVKMSLPRDMPENTDLDKANFVPLTYPVYLNRSGRFMVEVQAVDKIGGGKAELRYPLSVVELSTITK